MKKYLTIYKKFVVLLAVSIFITSLLQGCGSVGGNSGPSADDAAKYVGALLDLTCTGSYDESVRLSSVGKDKELEIRESILEDLYSSTVDTVEFPEDVRTMFHDFLIKAGQNCSYSVVGVAESENPASEELPEYDVTVSIKPLKAFKNASKLLDEEMDKIKDDTGKLVNTDPDTICSTAFRNLFTTLSEQLDNPDYGEDQVVVVHYYPIDAEQNLYGISEEDCTKMGEKLFSMEGLESN